MAALKGHGTSDETGQWSMGDRLFDVDRVVDGESLMASALDRVLALR